MNQATQDLQAMRVSSRARSQAQQDLWRSLKQLFEQNEYTEEALALRIMQALDQATNEPRTQALLPTNVIDMMRHLQAFLLPSEIPGPQQARQPNNTGSQQ